jgi:hypothetical protein
MITGIVPCIDASEKGFPCDLAIKSWSRVCDEIVIVTNRNPNTIQNLIGIAQNLAIPVKVRGIMRPEEHNVFRLFGYYFASRPDWVIHFDSDYVISPAEANKLRKAIESAPKNTEIITYKTVTMNYDGRRTVYNKDMKEWVPPYDGIRGEYAFVVNPRQQMFICPFEGVREDNYYINFEGCVSLSQEHWGKGVFVKERPNPYIDNRDGLRVVRSGVEVEHFMFTRSREVLQAKLQHPYWKAGGIDEGYVTLGQGDYPVTYPEIEEIRKRYSKD